jgi:bacterioferritin-associated ferredoxin
VYVCSCTGVTDRTIKAAIAAGAHTVDDIAERCGAGSRCGGCWPTLDELLEQAGIGLAATGSPPRRSPTT